jgi:ferredoxin
MSQIMFIFESQPTSRNVTATSSDASETLQLIAERHGKIIGGVCGGNGLCTTCKVKILSGTTSQRTSAENDLISSGELSSDYRLACQTKAFADVTVLVEAEN